MDETAKVMENKKSIAASGASAILRGSSLPETAAIQYYSVLKHIKIETIKYFIMFHNVL